jgi:hypothetical protein
MAYYVVAMPLTPQPLSSYCRHHQVANIFDDSRLEEASAAAAAAAAAAGGGEDGGVSAEEFQRMRREVELLGEWQLNAGAGAPVTDLVTSA